MTVHGAKGLQAPVVFLPDTTTEGGGPEAFLYAEEQGVLLPRVAGRGRTAGPARRLRRPS